MLLLFNGDAAQPQKAMQMIVILDTENEHQPLHEKSILREFTNIRKYSVNKWNCMHYPFAILFS